MTQSQVADAIHKSRSAISKIENGEQEIDVHSFLQWARATNAEAQAALIMFGAEVISHASQLISIMPAFIFIKQIFM